MKMRTGMAKNLCILLGSGCMALGASDAERNHSTEMNADKGVASEVREDGGETREIPVADFATVSNLDDPANWFSLWF